MNKKALIQRFLKAGNALREELSGRVVIHRTPEEIADVIFGRDMNEPQREEAEALRSAFLKPSRRQRLSNAIPGTYAGSWEELRNAYDSMGGHGFSPISNPTTKICAELVTMGLTTNNAVQLMHAVGYKTEAMHDLPYGDAAYLEGLEKLRKLTRTYPDLFEATVPEEIAWEFHSDQAYTKDA